MSAAQLGLFGELAPPAPRPVATPAPAPAGERWTVATLDDGPTARDMAEAYARRWYGCSLAEMVRRPFKLESVPCC